MNIFLKLSIALPLTAALAATGYKAQQAGGMEKQCRLAQQTQAALTTQIQQLQSERDGVSQRLDALAAENEQMKTSQSASKLMTLRAEVAKLQTLQASNTDSIDPAISAWLDRVNRLKQYVEDHPGQAIPEFQYLTDRDWLICAETGPGEDLASATEQMKFPAEIDFAKVVGPALANYSDANGGRFPTAMSQLQSYGDANMVKTLEQRYEIRTTSSLSTNSTLTMPNHQDQKVTPDWVIAGKDPCGTNTITHVLIYTNGWGTFWDQKAW